METKDKICGFILIREYPGCSKKVGDFVPYTTGEFLGYPEIWKPVYKKSWTRILKINKILGDNGK